MLQPNVPIRPPPLLPPVFFRVFTFVFLGVLLTSAAITFILPESYASTCRIKVEQDAALSGGKIPYEPCFLQTTFEVIQSQLVLDPVIAKLNLNAGWGKKYFKGETLKSAESRKILKGRTSLDPVRGTKLIAITVYSDDRNEAVRIADAIAESYRDYRVAAARDLLSPSQRAFLVQIVDRAEPGRYPVKPNKPLNIFIGAVAGVLMGSMAGAAVVFVFSRFGNRRRMNGAAA